MVAVILLRVLVLVVLVMRLVVGLVRRGVVVGAGELCCGRGGGGLARRLVAQRGDCAGRAGALVVGELLRLLQLLVVVLNEGGRKGELRLWRLLLLLLVRLWLVLVLVLVVVVV